MFFWIKKETLIILEGMSMIVDGVLVGVGLAGLELAIAWILACVINHEPASDQKGEEVDSGLKFSSSFMPASNIS